MPGSISVRNLDDEVIARLKRRAARHGRSAEAEVRDILARAVETEPNLTMAEFARLAAELRERTAGRSFTPSEVLQREGREER